MPYFVTCDACAFQEVVPAESDVLSRRDAHEAQYGPRHTMSVEAVEEQPLFRGGSATPW